MKKRILLLATAFIAAAASFAQFSFIHISDMHVSNFPSSDVDTNAQYFRCAIDEFASLNPKPAFVVETGDISENGNAQPNGMYPTVTQYLFPPAISNPAVGDYFIDPDKTIPIYFTPGNHEYWTGLDSIYVPVSNDTLFYLPEYIVPDTDYIVTTEIAEVVFLRSGHDSPYGFPPDPAVIMGTGLSNAQCDWLRGILSSNGSKRKIIVMHHPPVNAAGTNSDGTPFNEIPIDTATNSLLNNRTNFLNICDSNHVDVVLAGHEHQNVVADRKGDTVNENWPDGTRYVQTAALFNRSYRIITVSPAFVTVGTPMRCCEAAFGVDELNDELQFKVFPNPADDEITIECTRNADLEILNIGGQILKRVTTDGNQTTLDISKLPEGIYILKVKTDMGCSIRKLVIQ